MSFSSGSYDFNTINISINPTTNTMLVFLQLIDQTDGKIVSNKSILCPLDGVSPVLDGTRQLASQTPSNVITPAGTLLTNIQSALSGARDQNKLRP